MDQQTAPSITYEFGAIPAGNMFLCTFDNGKWESGSVQPFGNFTLSPFALCFHYGQTVFEGLKAFRQPDGSIGIFRHRDNFHRMNLSLERMGMPDIPYEIWEEGLLGMVKANSAFVPDSSGCLYLRPFVIATEEKLGVKLSSRYLFAIVGCPASDYYTSSLSVKVETTFTRAAKGGVGFAKCGGNYGASFYPFRKAKEEGFDQIIWTDAQEHLYVEESGTMNLAFIVDNELRTPPVSETILDGITRRSILELAAETGLRVNESPVRITDILHAVDQGSPVEAFGVGTAAVIAPFHSISYQGQTYSCYTEKDAQMFKLRHRLKSIQLGLSGDTHNWMTYL